MRKNDHEFKYVGSCPMCGARYDSRKILLVNRKVNFSQIHARCSICKSSAMMFIVRNASGFVTTIGMLTDMNFADTKKFRAITPMTSDDVIELHKLLESD